MNSTSATPQSVDPPRGRAPGGHAGPGNRLPELGADREQGLALSAAVGLGMLCAAAAGLLLEVYQDPLATSSMLRGYDLVTLALAVPCLALGLVAAARGSRRADVVVAAMLAFAVYNYAFYVLGTRFNALFLLHLLIVAGATWALVLLLRALRPGDVARDLDLTGDRRAAVALTLLAAGLAGMWVYASARFAVAGAIPTGSSLVETDGTVHLGIALDMWLLAPTYAVAATLLWRRRPWGPALGGIMLISGLFHQVSYLVALLFQTQADVPGAVTFDVVEPVIVLVYVLGCVALFRPRKPSTPASRSR